MVRRQQRAPVHPGEILREQFIAGRGMSIGRVARDLRVAPARIEDIVNERDAVTPEIALLLGRYFGTSVEFWLNLQRAYGLDMEGRVAGV